ncbi:MAG TPA: hypothetical protein VFP72_11085 [Kineosporiaceae bacterium]|nr:hypothetical protein [Kineosporiaceae bacterium]
MSLFVIAAGGFTAALVGTVVKLAADQRASGRAQDEAYQEWKDTGQLQPGWDPRFAWAEQAPPLAPAGRTVSVRAFVVPTDQDVVDAVLAEPLALPSAPEVTR